MRRRHATDSEKAGAAVGALLGVICFILLRGLILMLLWNAIVPALFAGPALGFWIAVLFSMLLGFLGGLLRGGGAKS